MLSLIKDKKFCYFLIYLGVTIFSLIFCAVYYIFSHGEKDGFMSLLFLPSAIASLLFILLFFFNIEFNKTTYYLFNSSFIFLWVFMVLNGIYNIAYVESKWLFVFCIFAIAIFVCAIVFEIISRINRAKNNEQ